MRLPLPLKLLAAMLVLAAGIELSVFGRLLWLPALPLATTLALAAARTRERREGA